MLENFNKESKKFQTPGFDLLEGYLLLSSLLLFVKELQENSADRILHYESETKGLCEDVISSFADTSKCIITKKFSYEASDRAYLRRADKSRIKIQNLLYDCNPVMQED